MSNPDSDSEILDVVVVGCGPVGALLAILLGRKGHRTRVFEREREVYRLPRAVHFDSEIMRIFQSVGLAPELEQETAAISAYEFRAAGGELLLRFGLDPAPTHQGWITSYIFHQPTLEALLRRSALACESVRLELEHEVISLEEHADHVALEVRDRTDGSSRRIRARYVVGCDGGNSPVRKWTGLELENLDFDEPWLVVDATVDCPVRELGLPEVVTQSCDPARPTTFVPGARGNIRWEFMMRPDERKEDMASPETVRRLISDWVDPNAVDVIRTAVYDFHALIAKQWGTRRVFIAGDAAHQMPPFLGQGMCSGLRDAVNLAWKLDLVLREIASEGLLATYGVERAPHVRGMIQLAVTLGRIVCTQDPQAAAKRDAEFLSEGGPDRPAPEMFSLDGGFRMDGVELSGKLGLQAPVLGEDGKPVLLDDRVGPGFALLIRGDSGTELAAEGRRTLASIAGRVVRLDSEVDPDGRYAEWFDRHACDAVLVRPDHYVFGAASGPDAAETVMEELRKRLND